MKGNPTISDGSASLSDVSGAKILSNVLSLSGGDTLSRVIAFAGTAYLARKLGPHGFGIIGFALALRSYFALVTTGGSNAVAAREVARRPGDATSIAASVILVRLVLACPAVGAMALIAWLIDKPLTTKLVIGLASLSFLTLAIDTSWVFKALERNRPVALSLVLGQTLFVILVLLFVRGQEDVVFVPVAQFLGEVIGATLLAVIIFRLGPAKWNFGEGLRVLRSSGNVLACKILRTVIFNFDVLLLGFLLGERAVGHYVAPYRFCFMLLSVAVTIHVSYLPTLTRAAKMGLVALAESTNRALAFSAAVAAPLIVGGMIEARPLLKMLFGSEYLDGTPALRLLILSIGLIFFMAIYPTFSLVRDQTSMLTWITAPATAMNVALNFLLIPVWGIVGAAASTVVAEMLILIFDTLVIRAGGVRFRLDVIWRPALAAAVMGAALFGLRSAHNFALSVAVGAVVYVAALVLLRGVPEEVRLGLWSSRIEGPQ